MRRFKGEPLPSSPKVAVLANDALGNYVISTPLLAMLRDKYPDVKLHYFSGSRVEELASSDPKVDVFMPLLGMDPFTALSLTERPFDLIVNIEWSPWVKCFATLLAREDTYVCGPALAPDGRGDWAFPDDSRGDLWRDQEWISESIVDRYPFLESPFIGEFFCRLAYLDGPVPRYDVPGAMPPIEVPDLLIATAASLPEKLWPIDKWLTTLQSLVARGHSIGLIGAKPSTQMEFWQGGSGEEEIVASGLVADLRGSMRLPEVVGALAGAQRVLTLDNGILHLAVATGTATVGLYRHGIHRLWAPPYANLTVLTAGENARVSDIDPAEVLRAL